jgi:hypothetical protein
MKRVVIMLGALAVLAMLATLIVHTVDPVVGAVIGTATVFLGLGLYTVAVVTVTAWFVKTTYKDGAEIALRAQESDDRRDVAMISAVGKMSSLWKESQQAQRPALPLPSQQANWLPVFDEEVSENG